MKKAAGAAAGNCSTAAGAVAAEKWSAGAVAAKKWSAGAVAAWRGLLKTWSAHLAPVARCSPGNGWRGQLRPGNDLPGQSLPGSGLQGQWRPTIEARR